MMVLVALRQLSREDPIQHDKLGACRCTANS